MIFKVHQLLFPFYERRVRLRKRFKGAIVLGTLAALGILAAVWPNARERIEDVPNALRRLRFSTLNLWGIEPTSDETRSLLLDSSNISRRRSVGRAKASFDQVYAESWPKIRAFLDAAGFSPDEALLRPGDLDQVLLLSGRVFEADDRGRSYRFKPNTRSVWVRNADIGGGFNKGPLQIPDTPQARTAAEALGATVELGSTQLTNSWGLRGPEPNPKASLRGIVLGDSFMQGMFLADDATPVDLLKKHLDRTLGLDVSILNTGHAGYATEQYYYSLMEYSSRFNPTFVILSVYANDFDGGRNAEQGDWEEAAFWVREIERECWNRDVILLIVPAPRENQVKQNRREYPYPARLTSAVDTPAARYFNPLDDFINAQIALMSEGTLRPSASPLFNGAIDDGHFSAKGAAVWAESVGRRLTLLLRQKKTKPSGRSVREGLSSGS